MNQKVAFENPDLKTQFKRAMEELRIHVIFALSPQAKGRVERLFDTLQDRLVKELRLKSISSMDEANQFLEQEFIPSFNKRFAVAPASDANLHQALADKEREQLPSIFSRKEERTVQNDFTFSFKNRWHQITEQSSVTVCKKDVVSVEEHLDGSLHVRLRGKELDFAVLPERPKKASVPWVMAKSARTPTKPPVDHPWRRRFQSDAARHKQYS